MSTASSFNVYVLCCCLPFPRLSLSQVRFAINKLTHPAHLLFWSSSCDWQILSCIVGRLVLWDMEHWWVEVGPQYSLHLRSFIMTDTCWNCVRTWWNMKYIWPSIYHDALYIAFPPPMSYFNNLLNPPLPILLPSLELLPPANQNHTWTYLQTSHKL